MKLFVFENPEKLGLAAAKSIASKLRSALDKIDTVNLLLSTGASQFSTLEALIKEDVDYSRIVMYHLDEYVGISPQHSASFCKYLKERFVDRVPLKDAVYINGEGNAIDVVARLNNEFKKIEIDVGVIGIGENGHIAFNDPPADFGIQDAYHIVTLDDACKRQQVREGWFSAIHEVPNQAISITCAQIMRCKAIVSPVPYAVKAQAISNMLATIKPTSSIPSSLLLNHPDVALFLDKESVSLTKKTVLDRFYIL